MLKVCDVLSIFLDTGNLENSKIEKEILVRGDRLEVKVVNSYIFNC